MSKGSERVGFFRIPPIVPHLVGGGPLWALSEGGAKRVLIARPYEKERVTRWLWNGGKGKRAFLSLVFFAMLIRDRVPKEEEPRKETIRCRGITVASKRRWYGARTYSHTHSQNTPAYGGYGGCE